MSVRRSAKAATPLCRPRENLEQMIEIVKFVWVVALILLNSYDYFSSGAPSFKIPYSFRNLA
jgi:hypothetical protein